MIGEYDNLHSKKYYHYNRKSHYYPSFNELHFVTPIFFWSNALVILFTRTYTLEKFLCQKLSSGPKSAEKIKITRILPYFRKAIVDKKVDFIMYLNERDI